MKEVIYLVTFRLWRCLKPLGSSHKNVFLSNYVDTFLWEQGTPLVGCGRETWTAAWDLGGGGGGGGHGLVGHTSGLAAGQRRRDLHGRTTKGSQRQSTAAVRAWLKWFIKARAELKRKNKLTGEGKDLNQEVIDVNSDKEDKPTVLGENCRDLSQREYLTI